jgi:hypothetical protein
VTREKASKRKIEFLQHVLGATSYFFKSITIFDNCVVVKSYKIDRVAIAERARAVEILVSGVSLRSSYSLYLSVYLVFSIS